VLPLHEVGGFAAVTQLLQVASLKQAISCEQQEAVRQASQVGSPVLKPQPVPPLLVDVLVAEVLVPVVVDVLVLVAVEAPVLVVAEVPVLVVAEAVLVDVAVEALLDEPLRPLDELAGVPVVVAGPGPVLALKPPCPPLVVVPVAPVGPCVALPPVPPPKPPLPSLTVAQAAARGMSAASERMWRLRMTAQPTPPVGVCPSRFRRADEASLPTTKAARRRG
jgi:hypothetical protein